MADFDLSNCVLNATDPGGFSMTGSGSPWLTGPAALVTQHLGYAVSYADTAFSNSMCFLNALANYAPTLNDVTATVNFDEITLPDPVFAKPDVPESPTLDLVLPTFPPDFVPGDIHEFDENVVGTVPDFSATEPTINLPATPGELDVDAPTDGPTITTEFTFPDVGDYTLPAVPAFEDLDIPTAPTITLPTFELDYPTVPADLHPPGLTFSFAEGEFDNELYAALVAELLDRIQNGGTGLHPDIEQAIWDRARNREDQNSVRTINQIQKEQAAKGWSRPDGSVLAAIDAATQEVQHKNADLSREIAIKQADLEQKNIEFALQTSLALEQSLLEYHNQVQQRAFEVEKYIQEVAINLYKAYVEQFNLQLEVYKTYTQSYEVRVKGELAKAEVFKVELEGQKLIGEINAQAVDLYRAQIEGIKISAETYKTQVEAVEARIKAEALKLENFKTQVDVFATQVSAKRDEYSMYAEAVKGEMAKLDIFNSQVKAFISRVDAYAKQVDAEAKRVDIDIEVEGLRLKEHLAKLEAIIKQTDAQVGMARATTEVYRGQAQMFTAEVGAESSRLEAETKVYDLQIRRALYASEVDFKNAQIALENAKNSTGLLLEAMKSGAQVGSSLAAASLSAMDIGANVSGSSQDIHNYEE
jgi:hypothetical protein